MAKLRPTMYVVEACSKRPAGSPVALLTAPEGALISYETPQGWSRNFAVNRTVRGAPVRIPNGWWMRGFEDFQRKDLLYLIDTEKKILSVGENNISLLMDGDKICEDRHYTFYGSITELVEAFQGAGYTLRKR